MQTTNPRRIRRGLGALLAVVLLAAGCASTESSDAPESSAVDDLAGAEPESYAPEELPAQEPPPEEVPIEPLPDDALPVPAPAPTEPAPFASENDPLLPPAANPFTATADDPLSTFALDVDTGSYSLARATLRNGALPDPSQIRIEEFVNAIDQQYPSPPSGEVFSITADSTVWPYSEGAGRHLVRIGMASEQVAGERRPAALTFVVDTSGSMAEAGRLALVRDSLDLLVDNLRPDDTVALVTYSDDAEVILPPTPAAQAHVIQGAISELTPDGSTNLASGLDLGYQLARRTLREGGINRVILASDGIANTGLTDGGAILETIRADAELGVEMVTVGVGVGDFNDALMEQLADEGDGFYAYIDTLEEAQQLFSTDLTSTLQTVAREARVQVEFDPTVVAGYRLLGFENRDLPDEQFRDDQRDAGEVGAGHQVTALYEVQLTGSRGRLGTTRLRWQDPETGEVHEIARDVDATLAGAKYTAADPMLQLDGLVAAWASAMRGDGMVRADPRTLAGDAARVADIVGTAQAAEIAELIGRWAELT
jgi:Ca-activated chloride channel homolog